MGSLVDLLPVFARGRGHARILEEYLTSDERVLFHAVRSERFRTIAQRTVIRFPAHGSLLSGAAILLSIEPDAGGHRILATTVLRSSVGLVIDHA